MKFTEHLKHLGAHITLEWQNQYINYEEMNADLYAAVEAAPTGESARELLPKYIDDFDEIFFITCNKELKKINTFYAEKLAEATRKFASLQGEVIRAGADKTTLRKGKIRKTHKKIVELKVTFSEYYLSLILLQTYQILNYMGFRKIIKKHDKLFQINSGAKWRSTYLESSNFHMNQDVYWLITETESLFANVLEGGDRQKALKKLRVPPLGDRQSSWTTFQLGLFSGSCIILFIVVFLSISSHEISDVNLRTAIRLYRGPFLLIEFIFLIGINVYGWRSSGVNHVLIFELDPNENFSEQHLMELAAVFGVVWALSVLCFIHASSLSIPPYVNPLVLVVTIVMFFINPFKVFRYEARFWFLRISARILAAPFIPVVFAQFWLADQWNSFAIAFLDFHFLICFYSHGGEWFDANEKTVAFESTRWFIISRALVNIIPAWTRFWQCLRRYRDCTDNYPGHLVNAAKYSTTFLVVILGTVRTLNRDNTSNQYHDPFLYGWLTCQMISSVFACSWDLKMDWGLFNFYPQPEHHLLRDEMVYSVKFYYCAMAENIILRFIWIGLFIITEYQLASGEAVISIAGFLEVFRRFIWNYFRLENEHLFNCGKFRVVHDIKVSPLVPAEKESIIRMIDHSDAIMTKIDVKELPNYGIHKKKSKVFFHEIATEILGEADTEKEVELYNLQRLSQMATNASINIDRHVSIAEKNYHHPSCSYEESSGLAFSGPILPTDLDGCARQQSNYNMSNFKEKLGLWSLDHQITQVAVKDLFEILNEHYYVCIPFRLHSVESHRYRCIN